MPFNNGLGPIPSIFLGQQNMPGGNIMLAGMSNYNFQQNMNLFQTSRILFLTTLNLLQLTKLTNDSVRHLPHFPTVLTKLPSNIPKFKGRAREYPSNHFMTFHLLCSSNSLMDDSIRLRFFQCTLIGLENKWYMESASTSFVDFANLATTLSNHF